MYGIEKSGPRPAFFCLACILAACLTLPSAGNGISEGKVKDLFHNQTDQRNNLGYNEQLINGNGREQKLNSAKDKSNTGQVLAATTGASLIATGSAMVPSIITPVSVAG